MNQLHCEEVRIKYTVSIKQGYRTPIKENTHKGSCCFRALFTTPAPSTCYLSLFGKYSQGNLERNYLATNPNKTANHTHTPCRLRLPTPRLQQGAAIRADRLCLTHLELCRIVYKEELGRISGNSS